MSYRICPRCEKSREVSERIETKNGKTWMIEYCYACKWNYDIHDYTLVKRKSKGKKYLWDAGDEDYSD